MHSRQVLPIAILGVLLLVGCTSRSPLARPMPGVPSPGLPDDVTVHTLDGRAYELHHSQVEGDSLIGYVQTAYRSGSVPRDTKYPGMARTAIALHDISKIERIHFSAWKTVALGLAVAAAGIGIAIGVAFSNWDPGPLV